MADPKSEQIKNNVAGFGGNLSAADTDVQKALETINDLSIGGGGVQPGDPVSDLTNDADYQSGTEVDSTVATHAAIAAAHHAKYTDGEAVTAMGVKADDNSLNHDKYTDSEAGSVADGKITTHTAIAAAHHAKYTDGEAAAQVTFENLDANGDVGTGATQVAQGDHSHDGVYLKLDTSNGPVTGDFEVSKADPEIRVTDTGNSEYSRLLKEDTDNKSTLYNRVDVTATDGNDTSTILLMHCNGADNGTVFTDSAEGGSHTITANGSAVTKIGEKVFGSASAYFPGTSADYLTITDDADLALGGDDFTFEIRFYPTTLTGYRFICIKGTGSYPGFPYILMAHNDITLYLSSTGSSNNVANAKSIGTAIINTWNYVVISKRTDPFTGISKYYVFLNGVLTSSWNYTADLYATTGDLTFGNKAGGVNPFIGYMDEIVLTKECKWTESFTPTDHEYTDNVITTKEVKAIRSYDATDFDGIVEVGEDAGKTIILGSKIVYKVGGIEVFEVDDSGVWEISSTSNPQLTINAISSNGTAGLRLQSSADNEQAIIQYNGLSNEIQFLTGDDDSTLSKKIAIDRTTGDLRISADDRKASWGAANDASMYYDGTNFVIDPQAVGSGYLDVLAPIKATGYIENIVYKTAAYTATINDDNIMCGAGNETFTITLPALSGITGKVYTIKNIGTGTITVDGNGSETIDGQLTQSIAVQYGVMKMVAGSSEWHIICNL